MAVSEVELLGHTSTFVKGEGVNTKRAVGQTTRFSTDFIRELLEITNRFAYFDIYHFSFFIGDAMIYHTQVFDTD